MFVCVHVYVCSWRCHGQRDAFTTAGDCVARSIARRLLNAIVNAKSPLVSLDMTSQLLVFLTPVLRDDDTGAPDDEDAVRAR